MLLLFGNTKNDFFLHCCLYFRTINGFLNTGKGGVVYLGIIDSGAIRGIQLTQYQVSNVAIKKQKLPFPKSLSITKTCPYTEIFFSCKNENFIRKILIFFLFLLKNIDCGYIEPPQIRCTPAYPIFFLHNSGVQGVYLYVTQTCYTDAVLPWMLGKMNNHIFEKQ